MKLLLALLLCSLLSLVEKGDAKAALLAGAALAPLALSRALPWIPLPLVLPLPLL